MKKVTFLWLAMVLMYGSTLSSCQNEGNSTKQLCRAWGIEKMSFRTILGTTEILPEDGELFDEGDFPHAISFNKNGTATAYNKAGDKLKGLLHWEWENEKEDSILVYDDDNKDSDDPMIRFGVKFANEGSDRRLILNLKGSDFLEDLPGVLGISLHFIERN